MTRSRRPRTWRRWIERVEKVCIWTPDKDLAQCVVGDRVVQVDRRSGEIRDDAQVRAKFGVAPAFIADYLALVGDAADGYPGIPGIGPKTAARLIGQHGHLEQFPASVLGDNRERALLFKNLATLRTDAPLFDDVEQIGGRSSGRIRSSPRKSAMRVWQRECYARLILVRYEAETLPRPRRRVARRRHARSKADRTPPAPRCTRSSIANGSGSSRRIRCGRRISATAAGTTAGRTSAPSALAARHAHRESVLKDLAAIPRDGSRLPTASITTSSGISIKWRWKGFSTGST